MFNVWCPILGISLIIYFVISFIYVPFIVGYGIYMIITDIKVRRRKRYELYKQSFGKLQSDESESQW